MEWEYKTDIIPAQGLQKQLNALGLDGWEVVSMLPLTIGGAAATIDTSGKLQVSPQPGAATRGFHVLLKRPVPGQEICRVEWHRIADAFPGAEPTTP